MVRFYDGAADIEPHAHAIGFGAEKWLKNVLNNGFSNARSTISYLYPEHGGEDAGIKISSDFDGLG